MQTCVPWGRDGNSLQLLGDMLGRAVWAVYRPSAQPVVSVLLQLGWWALRLRARWLGAAGQVCSTCAAAPSPCNWFQAMLRDASEGRPPEPPAELPSACSQVRGQAASRDVAWGSELGAQACAAQGTQWVPVLCPHSPQN